MTNRFIVQNKQYMELNPVSERQRREVTGFASGRIESEMKQSFMEVEMVMKKKWMVLMTLTMSLTAAIVKTSDRGATFYQKASYDAYEKEGMEGGRLFTIGASVNSSFSELPSFEYIGFDEDSCMNYYAELPTDYQAYMGDASIQAEYDALWSQVKDVIAGIRIGSEIQAGNETVDVDGNGLGDERQEAVADSGFKLSLSHGASLLSFYTHIISQHLAFVKGLVGGNFSSSPQLPYILYHKI